MKWHIIHPKPHIISEVHLGVQRRGRTSWIQLMSLMLRIWWRHLPHLQRMIQKPLKMYVH